MKLIKRGIKSIIKDPSLLFYKNKQTLKVHFDMHHGHGNLDKAVSLMNESERDEFNLFLNNSTSYNPHIIFQSCCSTAIFNISEKSGIILSFFYFLIFC